jgi:hypothetical protein
MVTDDAGHGFYEEFDDVGSADTGPVIPMTRSGIPVVPVILVAPIGSVADKNSGYG